jgi:hypothetical protein
MISRTGGPGLIMRLSISGILKCDVWMVFVPLVLFKVSICSYIIVAKLKSGN